MRTTGRYLAHALLVAGLVSLVGCGGPATEPPQGHGAHPSEGPHEGALVEWGEEEYHPEFTVDHDAKKATVYILGPNAKDPEPIPVKSIDLSLTNVDPVVQIKLEADPQQGDPEGKSSRFTGTHEALGKVMDFKGTLGTKIGDEPYFGEFDESKLDHDH